MHANKIPTTVATFFIVVWQDALEPSWRPGTLWSVVWALGSSSTHFPDLWWHKELEGGDVWKCGVCVVTGDGCVAQRCFPVLTGMCAVCVGLGRDRTGS